MRVLPQVCVVVRRLRELALALTTDTSHRPLCRYPGLDLRSVWFTQFQLELMSALLRASLDRVDNEMHNQAKVLSLFSARWCDGESLFPLDCTRFNSRNQRFRRGLAASPAFAVAWRELLLLTRDASGILHLRFRLHYDMRCGSLCLRGSLPAGSYHCRARQRQRLAELAFRP